MANRYSALSWLLMLAFWVHLAGCRHEAAPDPVRYLQIRLHWIPAHSGQSLRDMEAGLAWSLSYLGAHLPAGNIETAINYGQDSTFFELDLGKVGFSGKALENISVIVAKAQDSEEYRLRSAISLGRFLVLCLHSSWHYYEITGQPKTLDEFLRYHRPDSTATFAVLNSSVSLGHRLVQIQLSGGPAQMLFVAEDIDGAPDEGAFTVRGYEVFDLMPNGQLRFAIYDEEGQLAPAAPVQKTRAGKPSKCLWCHESKVQPLFIYTPDVEGFISRDSFHHLVDFANQDLQEYRRQLAGGVDFQQLQDHSQSEVIYSSFMEPSAQAVALEWGWQVEEVEAMLEGLPSHINSEYPFLGTVYFRSWADSLAPFSVLPVPESVREPNGREPNYFR